MKLKRKRVLVTGGAGFIGSHVVDRIAAEDPDALVVVDNLFLGREVNLADARLRFPSLKLHVQDASDCTAIKRIVQEEQIEIVFNLAVIPLLASLEQPLWSVDTNIGITTAICELAREACYETLIHCSSSEVYGTAQQVPMSESHPLLPLTPYAAAKSAADHITLSYRFAFDIDAAIARPFNCYGPRQNSGPYAAVIPAMINRAIRGQPIEIFGDGRQTRDFIFVHDTADAIVRIYETPATRGRVINIATGREVSVNELVSVLRDVFGTDLLIVHKAPRPADVRRHCGDISLARELMGFSPTVSLEEGLRMTVQWYLAKSTDQRERSSCTS